MFELYGNSAKADEAGFCACQPWEGSEAANCAQTTHQKSQNWPGGEQCVRIYLPCHSYTIMQLLLTLELYGRTPEFPLDKQDGDFASFRFPPSHRPNRANNMVSFVFFGATYRTQASKLSWPVACILPLGNYQPQIPLLLWASYSSVLSEEVGDNTEGKNGLLRFRVITKLADHEDDCVRSISRSIHPT